MITDFTKLGEIRYKDQNRYQIYCKKAVRDRLASLRKKHPDYIFDIDESGQFIEAHEKLGEEGLAMAGSV